MERKICTKAFQIHLKLNKPAPLKEEIVQGNNAPFMTRELRKTIMNSSILKKKYQDCFSRENFTS